MAPKRKLAQTDSVAAAIPAEEDWQRPSSFNKLVKNLKKSSKRSTITRHKEKRAKLDKDDGTIERNSESGAKVEAEDGREADPKSDETVNGIGAERVEEDEVSEDEANGAFHRLVRDKGVRLLLRYCCVSEDAEDEATNEDAFERHFGDHVSESLVFKAAEVDANAWETSAEECPNLKNVLRYHLKGASIKGSEERKTVSEFCLKKRLVEPWEKLNAGLLSDQKGDSGETKQFTPLQLRLFQTVNSYPDVLYSNESHANSKEIRHLYALHAVNHIFKTRDRVLKNSAKLKDSGDDDVGELRDQGFTRPKVLILLPFKNTALEVVKILIALSGTKQQDNKKRFFEEFSLPPEEDVVNPKKPDDFNKMFAGNIDDCFRVGIKFSRKQMKLFADFYSSDIIVASPLGLRMVIGAEGDKKRDFDFLSSIEMVILDNSEIFLMQNWDHVQHIFNHLNLIPKDSHGCDFSRVRSYYLDGRAKNVRQTLIFSHFITPEINALFNKHCKNVGGKVKIKRRFKGSIADVMIQLPQVFHRIPCTNPATAADARFTFFIEKMLPTLRTSALQQKHTLIFIPSYLDFVRVRNYLKEHNYVFGQMCEYTPGPDISRARLAFFKSELGYLVYTERFHFFRRYKIRGVHHIAFYGLPEFGDYYAEMVNAMDGGPGECACTVAYTKYDRLKLERVVGSKRSMFPPHVQYVEASLLFNTTPWIRENTKENGGPVWRQAKGAAFGNDFRPSVTAPSPCVQLFQIPMKIACLQFAPKIGDPAANRKKAEDLLQKLGPDDNITLLVLPELAFSGYVFKDLDHIRPFLEDGETGDTVQWAKQQAKRLHAYVQIGYPRIASTTTHRYNSVCLVSPTGEVVVTYDKHFLYETDERWASEGSGFLSVDVGGLGKVGIGICMDLNPYRFTAPFEAYEFATFHCTHNTQLVICSMAWILSHDPTDVTLDAEQPSHDTLVYWVRRLSPLAEKTREEGSRVVVVVSNRVGTENGITFCGTSTVIEFVKGRARVLGVMGRGEEGLLIVEEDEVAT
ncbi:hypothetical protein HK104_006505 [Borealophlyctis nickersoniae]|nr:hypothetical protein HK104_006505 [Borealophlyctis nickersoniae]